MCCIAAPRPARILPAHVSAALLHRAVCGAALVHSEGAVAGGALCGVHARVPNPGLVKQAHSTLKLDAGALQQSGQCSQFKRVPWPVLHHTCAGMDCRSRAS